METKINSLIKSIKLSFSISFKASKSVMLFRMFMVLVGAFVPFLNALAIKNIINAITLKNVEVVWKWFFIFSITQILSATLSKITSFISQIHNEKINIYISSTIIDKINDLDISYYDNTKLYNEVKNVTRESTSIPNITWNVMSFIKVSIQLLYSSILISKVGWWLPLIIIIACIPNYLFDKYYSLKLYNWSRETTNDVRKINYLYSSLTEKYFSKDIRVNNLQNELKKEYKKRWKNWFLEKLRITKKHFVFTFFTMFIPHVITLLIIGSIIIKCFVNEMQPGDITYNISVIGQLISSTFGFISIITTLIKENRIVESYEEFLSWKSNEDNGDISCQSIETIEFQSVSFAYPDCEKKVLNNVSFKIQKGDKVAIIGKNGSGKSTIIKLLLKFYKPTGGKILINGIDINEINSSDIYKIVSVMFQDFINYSFKLSQNLDYADINRNHTNEDYTNACLKGNSYCFVSLWKNKFNTYLTKSFDEEGMELSGGQWQRLALSRSFMKDAYLFVYDEPAASLDIEAEHEIYKELVFSHKDKTLILVSHRMSYMNEMTKIIVMDEGNLIECGTHCELMNNNNLYSHLYNIKTILKEDL